MLFKYFVSAALAASAVVAHGDSMARVNRRDININVPIDVNAQVNAIVGSAHTQIGSAISSIKTIVSSHNGQDDQNVANNLKGHLTTIHNSLQGAITSLSGMKGSSGSSKRAVVSQQQVAQTVSGLLQTVAGAVNSVETLADGLPIIGSIVAPLFNSINGDLSLILSSVGNLVVGVVDLVQNLLQGVLGVVSGLPIVGQLLSGLLGGLLNGVLRVKA